MPSPSAQLRCAGSRGARQEHGAVARVGHVVARGRREQFVGQRRDLPLQAGAGGVDHQVEAPMEGIEAAATHRAGAGEAPRPARAPCRRCDWRSRVRRAPARAAGPPRRGRHRRRRAAAPARRRSASRGCAAGRAPGPAPSVLSPCSCPSPVSHSVFTAPAWCARLLNRSASAKASSLKGTVTFMPLPPAAKNSRAAAAKPPERHQQPPVLHVLPGLCGEAGMDHRRARMGNRVAGHHVAVGHDGGAPRTQTQSLGLR